MSSEIVDQSSPGKASKAVCESQKPAKVSYTREFLLSLSELDVCKKLPSGFNQSVLSGLEDASHGVHDGPIIPGSSSFQGVRRNDYGSSPPTRGDSGNYPRGIYGRWDSRSSGWSDRDSDTPSDWDSDSGTHYGNQSQRSWQTREHDGLLGSGTFPKPSGYAPGMLASKVQLNDHFQLNRSSEPYQPPRPYKAVPHSKRDTNDSYNDETFGSAGHTSQDRAEEERRRRASFELMRREQQRELQEKQKLSLDKRKDDPVSGITVLLEDSKEEKGLLDRNHDELDATASRPASNGDSSRSSVLSQIAASRPLVPPGFTSIILERNSGENSVIRNHSSVDSKADIVGSLLHVKADLVQHEGLNNQEEQYLENAICLSDQQSGGESIHGAFVNKGEKLVCLSEPEASNKQIGMDDHLYRTSSVSEAHIGEDEVIEFDIKGLIGHKVGDSNTDGSTSILEKLFGNALNVTTAVSSGFVEHYDGKLDGTWRPDIMQSSKFAPWFFEEEKKPADDLSSSRSSDLLSLIVGGEKGGVQNSDVKSSKHIPKDSPCQSSELTQMLMASSTSSNITGLSCSLYDCTKQEAVPAILTCEDLEHTILSEYSEKGSTLQPSVQEWTVSSTKTEQPKVTVDDRASQHILSLLQKEAGLNHMAPPITEDTGSSDQLHVSEVDNVDTTLDKPGKAALENVNDLGKTLTLETLFGTAFMKELQSVEAPVSVQRGLVGSARTDASESHGLSFTVTVGDYFPATLNKIISNRTGGANVLAYNEKQQAKIDRINNWHVFDDSQIEVESLKLQKNVASKHGSIDRAIEIQLPEEESLITVGDPVNTQSLMLMPTGNSNNGEFLSSNAPVDISDKLAALNSVFKDKRAMIDQEGPSFVHDPYNTMGPESLYHDLHAQVSSQQFHAPPVSHGRPQFHSLVSHLGHVSSQMNLMAPDGIMHHATPTSHQFTENMLRPPFHYPSARMTGFDVPANHPMLQQMQMPGNFLPHLHEVPGATSLTSYPSNLPTSSMQEVNQTQGFPYANQRSNIGGLAMPLPAFDVDSGGNHPAAFQGLIEMELEANSKQIHPFAVGHSQGMYNDEVDLGFRYR